MVMYNLHPRHKQIESMAGKKIGDKYLENKCIPVYLRLKGGVPYEHLYQIDGDSLICKVPQGSYSSRTLKNGETMTRIYTFAKILNAEVTQSEIFNSIVKASVLGFINGKNSTLFTYGASGSGKTFTIVGTPEEPGLIPRALEYIFRTLPVMGDEPKIKPLPNGTMQELDTKLIRLENFNKTTILNATMIDKTVHIKTYNQMQMRLSSEPVAEIEDMFNVSVSIWVSFAEIYNENIHDLLVYLPKGKNKPKLTLGNNTDDQTYIKNLTTINVSNGLEAYQILQYGLHNLRYASTAINSHSSRSHSIFTVKLVQTSHSSDKIFVSSFNFCDLAGSERMKKTLNIGDRLKESNNINTSLLVLGRCIENIKQSQQSKDKRLIPFRESKLTQLFKRALMGFENIEMIVNINPSRDMFDETHHALNFSAIATKIKIDEKPKKSIRKENRFSQLMERRMTNSEFRVERENVDDDHADKSEIIKLRDMVTDLYNELEHTKQLQEEEIQEEKQYVADMYKKYYEGRLKMLEEEKNEEIEELHLKIQQIANVDDANVDDSVINISSSSNECNSPVKSQADTILDLRSQILTLKEDYALLKAEKEVLKEKSVREKKHHMMLLEDARILCEELKKEIVELTIDLKASREQLILLQEERERNEQLTLAYENSCKNGDSNDSIEDASTQNESTFSQSRIKEQDKKLY